MSPKGNQQLQHYRLRYLSFRNCAHAAVREEKFDGRRWLVIPTVALVGDIVVRPLHSEGPEFVPAEQLKATPSAWDGRPVLSDHPEGGRGSANNPRVLESQSFGVLFGTTYANKKLPTEVWIDPQRAERVGGDARKVLRQAEAALAGEEVDPIEVSVGAWVDLVREDGVAPDGNRYEWRWEGIVPDHLAVGLGGAVGACSVDAGCGAFREASGGAKGALQGSQEGPGVAIDENPRVGAPPAGASRPQAVLRVAALGQARRPTFSGTESVAWSAPSWADYVRYLHEGRDGPGSVREASMDLRRRVAAHSLLGDPEAENLRDLTMFPCVNPANGNLNERALRAVLGGRGAQADIPERTLTSARDVARRLLNSEFGANLEAAMSNVEKRSATESVNIQQLLQDAVAAAEPDSEFVWVESFDPTAGTVVYSAGEGGRPPATYRRKFALSDDGDTVQLTGERTAVRRKITYEEASSAARLPEVLVKALGAIGFKVGQEDGTSDVALREAMWLALNATVPGFCDIAAIFPETKVVIYAAEPEGRLHWWRRSYDLTEEGGVELADDAEEVVVEKVWKPVANKEAAKIKVSGSVPCGCGAGGSETGEGQSAPSPEHEEVTMSDAIKDLVGRLIANEQTPFTEGDEEFLSAKPEEALRGLLSRYECGEEGNAGPKPAAETQPQAQAPEGGGGEEEDTVTLTRSDAESILAAARAWERQQEEAKAALVKSLSSAQKTYSEERLRAKSVEELEELADLIGLREPKGDGDYSLRAQRIANEGSGVEPPRPLDAGIAALRKRYGIPEKEASN